jgi:3-oxoacyl-[acyl-carrier-protein] synthase III
MGITIKFINAIQDPRGDRSKSNQPRAVAALASQVLTPLLQHLPENISNFIVATSCPDSVAPSVGQCLNEQLHEYFSKTATYDIVQGCAGGVAALILGSQLAALNRSTVVVVAADAAQKATHTGSEIFDIFSNGAFACIIAYTDDDKRLMHTASQQFKGLYDVVTIRLGHDADEVIMANPEDMAIDPRRHLGLQMENKLALSLMRKAEQFFVDFTANVEQPDVLILHHVNPLILAHLEEVFSKFPVRFVNRADEVGNCGAATTGVVLAKVWPEVQRQKVMLCSFGTGGVITAGMWQL